MPTRPLPPLVELAASRADDEVRVLARRVEALEDLNAHLMHDVRELHGHLEAERRRSQRLGLLATTDTLTELPNRRAFEHALGRELARAARQGAELCVVLLDLDGLKAVNDDQGHAAGDALLRQAGAVWRPELRPSDLLARLGGDEFGVVLGYCDPEHAASICWRLRRALEACGATCSAGLACWDGAEAPAALVARADAELGLAKRRRRRSGLGGRRGQPELRLRPSA